jgi:hypothetical protein
MDLINDMRPYDNPLTNQGSSRRCLTGQGGNARAHWSGMVALGRVELPTFGLGNRCSIHLSYRADAT